MEEPKEPVVRNDEGGGREVFGRKIDAAAVICEILRRNTAEREDEG